MKKVQAQVKEDVKGKKPDLKKNQMKENKRIQTILKKIVVKVPKRTYKSGVVVPGHRYVRTVEKQIVHTAIAYGEVPEKKFKYVGRLKKLDEGVYPIKRKGEVKK